LKLLARPANAWVWPSFTTRSLDEFYGLPSFFEIRLFFPRFRSGQFQTGLQLETFNQPDSFDPSFLRCPMYLFSSKQPGKKIVDATPYMRRILDLTTPSRLRADEQRTTNRYDRGLPIAICKWERGEPCVESMQFGMTRDISDKGVALLTTVDVDFTEVVFTVLVGPEVSSELWFFQATIVRKCKYFGFVEYGMQINEFLNDDHRLQLQPLIQQLTQTPPNEEMCLMIDGSGGWND
jgi:hypothetical protein